jgi:signal transduction histidine kinase
VEISGQMQQVVDAKAKRGEFGKTIARWLLVLVLALAAVVSGAMLLLHASSDDLESLVPYLLATSGASMLLGLGVLLLLRRWPGMSLRLKVALPPLVAAVVISVNVYVSARLMFIADEDVGWLLVLLLFGFILSLGVAWAVAGPHVAIIRTLEHGARGIAKGDYSVRLPERVIEGKDELGQLGASFNLMTQRVQESFERQREAEQAQRQFMAAISHDLRTPLTSIRAMIEAIDDGVVTDMATIVHYVHTIRGETQHMSALIDDLFELSRLNAGALQLHRSSAWVDALVSDTLEAMRAAADEKGVVLIGHLESDLPPVRIDVQRIQRVFYNLLQNAIQHTPAGGAVLIRASALNGQGQGVLVDVIDTGIGIPDTDLPHIFDRFYRGEPSRARELLHSGGTHTHAGLGLTIARALVEAHGGQITALSPYPTWPVNLARPDTGPGTAFLFTLPS